MTDAIETTNALKNDFNPSKRIVLNELQQFEKEDWYGILQTENVQFLKLDDDKYLANIRILAPGINKKLAEQVLCKDTLSHTFTSPKKIVEEYQRNRDNEIQRQKAEIAFKRKHNFRNDLINLSEYKNVAELLDFDLLKPKHCPHEKLLPWVMRLIEEIYDARYVHDTAELKHEDDLEQIEQRPTHVFPVFLIEHFFKKYGLRSLVDQTCWDLIFNTHHFRKEFISVEIFARFMNEQYDADDLLFFLYVRSVIQKVLNVSFRNIWAESTGSRHKSQQALWLSYRECTLVARTVFGDEQDPMCMEFLKIIESQLVGRKRLGNMGQDTRRIEVTQVLHLAVLGYHDARPDGNDLDEDNSNILNNDIQSLHKQNQLDDQEFEKKFLSGNEFKNIDTHLDPSQLDKDLSALHDNSYLVIQEMEPYEEKLIESFVKDIDTTLLSHMDMEQVSTRLIKEIRSEVNPIIHRQIEANNLKSIEQLDIPKILSAIFSDEEFITKYRTMFFSLITTQTTQYTK